MIRDLEALRRKEFPRFSTGSTNIFMNSASTGPLPTRAIAAATSVTERRADPGSIADAEIFATLTRARARLAELISALPDEVALMPNTSFGVNVAANSLPLRAGDVVLISEGDFPANVYPWLEAQQRGVFVKFVPCVNGLPDEMRMLEMLDEPNVRAVAVSWVSFSNGYTVDLERLGKECRSRGIFLAVDGIQGLGARVLDCSHVHVDFFSAGCQKWMLSPWGTGFLYVRKDLIPQLRPPYAGWLSYVGSDDFAHLTQYKTELLPDARRFEVGTHGLQDYAALIASVELFLEVGPQNIADHIRTVTRMLTEWGESRAGVQLRSPTSDSCRAGIVTLGVPDAPRVWAELKEAGITCSLREGGLRFAPHMFNTEHELHRVIAAVEKYARLS